MIKFFPSLKHYFLKLFAYWNVKKVNSSANSIDHSQTKQKPSNSLTKPNKSTNSRSNSSDRAKNLWMKEYNQKPEVKARKHQDYLRNREKYNELRRQRRQLAKENKQNKDKPNENDKTIK